MRHGSPTGRSGTTAGLSRSPRPALLRPPRRKPGASDHASSFPAHHLFTRSPAPKPRPEAEPRPHGRRRRGLGAGRAGRRARDRSLPRARPAALEVRESERWPAPSLALPGALGVPSALGDPAAPGRTCCPTACPRRASGAAGGCWREPRPGSARGPLRPRFWCRCARCAGSRRCSTRCGPAAWSGGTRVKSGTPAGNSGPSRRPPSPGHHGEWPGRLARRALRL